MGAGTKWKQTTLGEVLQIKHGYAFKGEFFASEPARYIVVTPGNFWDEGGFKRVSGKEKFYTGAVPDEYVLSKGDLIVAMTEQGEGLLGSAALVPDNECYLHNQRIGLVTVKGDLDRTFAYYLFNWRGARAQIRASASGTKVRHTSPSRIYEVKVKLPSPSIQRRIASILSAYDELLANNSQRIKILEELAHRTFEEWFVHLRIPGKKREKSSAGADFIPAGWRKTVLGAVAENYDRLRKPLSSIERQKRPGPYPYYGAAKVFDHIDDFIFEGRYLLLAEDGSVITSDGTPVLQLTSGRFWANNHTHILRGREPILTEYLYLALKNYPIIGHVTGAAQPKITQANLNRIPVILPDEKTLRRFDDLILPLFEMRERLQEISKLLVRSRDFLLPKLISGEIDVGAAEEEALAVTEAA